MLVDISDIIKSMKYIVIIMIAILLSGCGSKTTEDTPIVVTPVTPPDIVIIEPEKIEDPIITNPVIEPSRVEILAPKIEIPAPQPVIIEPKEMKPMLTELRVIFRQWKQSFSQNEILISYLDQNGEAIPNVGIKGMMSLKVTSGDNIFWESKIDHPVLTVMVHKPDIDQSFKDYELFELVTTLTTTDGKTFTNTIPIDKQLLYKKEG